MLEFIRKHKSLFSIVFVISGVGLVVTMFYQPGQGGFSGLSLSSSAGRVLGEEVSIRELQETMMRERQQMEQMLEGQMQGDAKNREFMEQLLRSQVSPARILNRIMQNRFLIKISEELGFSAGKRSIIAALQENPSFQTEGRFDPVLYRQRVSERGRYEKMIKSQLTYMNLMSAMEAGLGLSSNTIYEQKKLLKRGRILEYLRVKPSEFKEPAKVDSTKIVSFLADPASEKELKVAFAEENKKFQSNEEVKASHILIKGDESAKKKLESIKADIASAKMTFEEAATKFSEDSSNAKNGGDLGYFKRNVMDADFERVAFETPINQVSEIVKSQFGYHLIKVFDKKGSSTKSFDSEKSRLAEKIVLSKAKEEAARSFMKRFETDAPPSPAELAKLGLKFEKIAAPWTPTEESLGSLGSVSEYQGLLLKLGPDSKYLKKIVNVGGDIAAIRFVEFKADENLTPPPSTPQKLSVANEDAVQKEVQSFLEKLYTSYEKEKKISVNEKALRALSSDPQG